MVDFLIFGSANVRIREYIVTKFVSSGKRFLRKYTCQVLLLNRFDRRLCIVVILQKRPSKRWG